MMQLATLLLVFAVFAALLIVAVAAALRAARIETLIGEVFSPWLHDTFETSGVPEPSDPSRLESQSAGRPVAAAPR